MSRIQASCVVALLAAVPALASHEGAVVGIYAERSGHSEQGTGFFISPDGDLLTCYHVIAGAKRIRLYGTDLLFDSVVIDSWAPEYDLARLRVSGLTQPVVHLPIAPHRQAPQKPTHREVYGYVRGGSLHRFPFELPRHGLDGGPFDRSDRVRSPGGRRVFRQSDVRILPLETTLYKGMSGGPVVSEEGVLGILSGAHGEGGTLSWAIPTDYLSRLRKVDKRAEHVTRWPEQTMLEAGWQHLVNSFSVDDHADTLTRAFVKEVHSLVEVYEALRAHAVASRNIAGDAMRSFRHLADGGAAGCAEASGVIRYLTKVGDIKMAIRPLATAYSDRSQVHERMRRAGTALHDAVMSRDVSVAPSRQVAKALLANTESVMVEEHARLMLNEAAVALIDALGEMDEKFERVGPPVSESHECKSQLSALRLLHESVRKIDAVLAFLVSEEMINEQLREIRKYRGVAAVSETLVYSD